MSDLPEKTSKLTLNASAAEWKPSAAAAPFVPSFAAPAAAPAAPATSTPPPAARVLKLTPSAPAPVPAAAQKAPAETPSTETAATKTAPKPASKPASKTSSKTEAKPVKPAEAKREAEKIEEDDKIDHELITDQSKEHLNVVFMGHVDAGKSTMGGNILFMTGMVDKRTMEKYEKEAKDAGRESWYLSWALDTNTEERAKGKTVECGRAHFETDKRRYTILDAPGHKNYVPSMLSGASQADLGVLVISARKGEFETGYEGGGQTSEHAILAKTSGINKMVVVINKMDDPTVNWDEERYNDIVKRFSRFLKTIGFNVKTDITFMPVSGYTGANIKDRFEACKWYSGQSLLEFLDDFKIEERKVNGPLMLPIAEEYKDMGAIVVGKIESGYIKKGMSAFLMPNKTSVEIATIYSETEEEVDQAICGDNVRVRFKSAVAEETSAGFVLCDKKNPVKVATQFEAKVVILEHKNIITAGYTCILHIHNAVEEVKLGALLHLIDKKTNKKTKLPPPFIKAGQKAIVRIETTEPICVEKFDDYPQLGRFTLRDEGKTIAIGSVTRVLSSNSE